MNASDVAEQALKIIDWIKKYHKAPDWILRTEDFLKNVETEYVDITPALRSILNEGVEAEPIAQLEQDGDCKYCVCGCSKCDARIVEAEQARAEALARSYESGYYAGVNAEREACAKVCEVHGSMAKHAVWMAEECAALIRARSEQ